MSLKWIYIYLKWKSIAFFIVLKTIWDGTVLNLWDGLVSVLIYLVLSNMWFDGVNKL